MKKLVFVVLVLFLCPPLPAYAIGIGSPTTNGQFKLGIGWDNDYVFNRDLKLKSFESSG
jgi:hypothetical protein